MDAFHCNAGRTLDTFRNIAASAWLPNPLPHPIRIEPMDNKGITPFARAPSLRDT